MNAESTLRIPSTDLVASRLCLGTHKLGKEVNREASFAILDRFRELGGNIVDTAHIYADWLPGERGSSEKTIGRWLNSRGCREELILVTKGGISSSDQGVATRLTPEKIRNDLVDSLSRLRTDCVDIYLLHEDDPDIPVRLLMETLRDLRDRGMTRYIGCSNWRAPRIKEATEYADKQGFSSFVINEIWFSLAIPAKEAYSSQGTVFMDDAERSFHEETGFPALAYTPQAGGFFSGRYGRRITNPQTPSGDTVRKTYYGDGNFQRLDRARTLAEKKGCQANHIALAYLLHQKFPVIPIVGARTEEQLVDSWGALSIEIEDREILYLETDSERDGAHSHQLSRDLGD